MEKFIAYGSFLLVVYVAKRIAFIIYAKNRRDNVTFSIKNSKLSENGIQEGYEGRNLGFQLGRIA